MIRYRLVDNENNTYSIDDDTIKILSDSFTIEAETIERSFQAGADFPGIQRDESKELTLIYDLNINNEQTFRTYYNNLTMQLRKTIILRDIINNIETDVLYISQNIEYDEGGFNKGAKITIGFIQLKPFWRDIVPQIEEETGLTSGELIINNNGYIETPSIITIEAIEQITKFSLRINETGDGMVIRDLQFGTLGLNTYIIDNGEGTVELNQILRNHKIKNETGFFNLRVGINTLLFEANGQATVTVQWKRRYYI